MAQICNASFNIKYHSSEPVKKMYVSYRDPELGTDVTHDIYPVPQNDTDVVLDKYIKTPDNYNLKIGLEIDSVATWIDATLPVVRCTPTPCEVPAIKSVHALENGQLVMEYYVGTGELVTVEYQIARDIGFSQIIYTKGGGDYARIEYIDMKNALIPNNTQLYMRVRKYCPHNGISDWQERPFPFTSGRWSNPIDAYCLTGEHGRNEDICYGTSDIAWKTKVTFNTDTPAAGTIIYLTNNLPASKENIAKLDDTVDDKFKEFGIRWIRFPSFSTQNIYVVEPGTGKILGIADDFKC